MNNFFYENKNDQVSYFETESLTNVPHIHKELELIIAIEGEAIAYADNKAYTLKTGDLFLAFPNEVHFYAHKYGKFGVCIFSPTVIYEQNSVLVKNYPQNNKIVPKDKYVLAAIDLIVHSQGEYQESMLYGCCNIIIPRILSQMNLTNKKADNTSVVKDFINYCRENYHEKLSLELIAKNLHINKYYLSHLLNDSLKISFSDYINGLRINEACNLLEKQENKIADISENIGYGTIRSFNRAFKQIMKISPSEYREKVTSK